MKELAEGQKVKDTLEAEGKANAIQAKGDADAHVTKVNGDSEAHVIKAKKVADAEGIEKQAEAMKKFDEAATTIKTLDVTEAIAKAKFNAVADALNQADVRLNLTGETAQKFFGLNLDASGGTDLQMFLRESGVNEKKITKVINSLNEESGEKQL